jgi:pimeloyl-ACP methyl ester carboxylesterase
MGGVVTKTINTLALHPNPYPVKAEDADHRLVYDELGDHLYYQTVGGVEDPTIVILYSYGNMYTTQDMNLQNDLKRIHQQLEAALRGHKVCIYYYDWPQYGKTDGEISEETMNATIWRMYDYIHEHHSKDAKALLLWGFSLGSSPTCYLANRLAKPLIDNVNQLRRPDGIILQSPVGEAVHLGTGWYTEDRTEPGWYDNIFRAKETPFWGPCVIFHGLEDKVVPPHSAEMIFAHIKSSPSRLELIPKKGHNNMKFKPNSKEFQVLMEWLPLVVPPPTQPNGQDGGG